MEEALMTALNVILYILSALLGLAVGSFLNVCIYRLPRGNFFSKARSFCPKCGAPIKAYDNIPLLSYIILRGKCRACHEPISPRYPIIEALNMVLWIVNYAVFGMAWQTLIADVLVSTLIVAAMVDIDVTEIPDSSVITIVILGLLSFIPGVGVASWQSMLIGAFCVSVPMLIISLFGGMGMGDVKLYFALGLLMGWERILVLFLMSFVIGSIIGITNMLIIKHKAKAAANGADANINGDDANIDNANVADNSTQFDTTTETTTSTNDNNATIDSAAASQLDADATSASDIVTVGMAASASDTVTVGMADIDNIDNIGRENSENTADNIALACKAENNDTISQPATNDTDDNIATIDSDTISQPVADITSASDTDTATIDSDTISQPSTDAASASDIVTADTAVTADITADTLGSDVTITVAADITADTLGSDVTNTVTANMAGAAEGSTSDDDYDAELEAKLASGHALPFGPAIVLASGIVLYFGDAIIQLYKSLIGL